MSIGRRTALVTASIIALLSACSDDDSPTAPDVPDMPEVNELAPVPDAPTASLADNGKIAFRSDRIHFTNWEIFVMNADGSAQTRVTNSSGTDAEPAWSPDGGKLAFYREGAGTGEPGARHGGDDVHRHLGVGPRAERVRL